MLGPEETDDKLVVQATALCTSEEHVARVSEVLARAATGLALEGIGMQIQFLHMPPVEE
jgi:hypothetical protein